MEDNTSYFLGCYSIQQIKDRFRELCFKYHPDICGEYRTMQVINEQYHERLKGKHETTFKATKGNGESFEATYRYDYSKESALTDMIYKIVGLRMADTKLEVIGSWLWLSGETKPHKEALKGLGFKFSGPKQAWSWHEGPYFKRRKGAYSMDTIRSMFGSEEVRINNNQIGY